MRKVDHGRNQHEAKMDMTPMIDLTFLLVMFFVLTSAFTTLNLEDVLLPVALSASDQHPTESTLIVNIKKTDDATREGEIVFNGKQQTPVSLREALHLEAEVHAARAGWEMGPGNQKLSKLEVIVRADEGVRSEYLRQVFLACQKEGIYKLKLSALEH